jgi:peptide/nickel transport system substrate-binding protein
MGYNSPQVDDLLDKARSVTDQNERRKLYGRVQTQLSKDVPMLPLFFSTEYAASANPSPVSSGFPTRFRV